MTILIIIFFAAVMFTVFLKGHSRHKFPCVSAIAGMTLGVISLVLIAPVVSAAVNVYTVFAALTLGIPGTLLVVLVTFIAV
jgi:hypothetical protein